VTADVDQLLVYLSGGLITPQLRKGIVQAIKQEMGSLALRSQQLIGYGRLATLVWSILDEVTEARSLSKANDKRARRQQSRSQRSGASKYRGRLARRALAFDDSRWDSFLNAFQRELCAYRAG